MGAFDEVIQNLCTDAKCTTDCKNGTFPTGKCLATSDPKYFAKVTCNIEGSKVNEKIFDNKKCTGTIVIQQSFKTNECQFQTGGGSLTWICANNNTVTYTKPVPMYLDSSMTEYF